MKPTNRFYGYSPAGQPDEGILTQCTHCKTKHWSFEWRRNLGKCPICQKAYAGPSDED